MKRSLWFILPVFLLLTAFTTKLGENQAVSFQDGEDGPLWMSVDEALTANETEPRMFLLNFYTDWCGWCKRMDESTFSNPQITELMAENYHPIKFNAEADETVVTKDGTYNLNTTGRRPTHELATELATLNERLGYPTVVIMDEEWNRVKVYQGYRSVDDLKDILTYYGSERYYKEMNWAQFIQERSGE